MRQDRSEEGGVCPECGAPVPPGGSCRASFHALLALEWDVPGGAGPTAHFYAVAAYVLQHPGSMGYTQAAVDDLRDAVRDVLEGRASLADVRERARRHAAAAGRVTRREGDAAPAQRVLRWPTVVTDVIAHGVAGYREHVER